MNLFEVTITEGARAAVLGSQQIDLPDTLLSEVPALRAYADKRVVLGVRPEDLSSLGPGGGGGSSPCVLMGQAELVEALGSEQLIHFTTDARAVDVHGAHEDDAAGLNEGTIRRGGEGIARIDARSVVRAGDTVRFHIDPLRLRFFDIDTTDAIVSSSGTGVMGNGRGGQSNGSTAEPVGLSGSEAQADGSALEGRAHDGD